jgi:hypothetical protein
LFVVAVAVMNLEEKIRGVTLQGLKISMNLVILYMNIMINLEPDA